MNDPGGQLGPVILGDCPDLRNLRVASTSCNADDYIILCTDGLISNLDPENIGFTPKDLASLISKGSTKAIAELPISWRTENLAMSNTLMEVNFFL